MILCLNCCFGLQYARKKEVKDEYDKYSKPAQSNNPEDLKSAIAFFESESGYLDTNKLVQECKARLPKTEKRLEKEKTGERKPHFRYNVGGIFCSSHYFYPNQVCR